VPLCGSIGRFGCSYAADEAAFCQIQPYKLGCPVSKIQIDVGSLVYPPWQQSPLNQKLLLLLTNIGT
jgi:hypothetical protein